MIIDSRTEFCSNVALSTQAAGSRAVLGNVLDLGQAGTNLGQNADLYLVLQVSQSATSAGAATVEFQLVSDDRETLSTDGTATIHLTTGPVGLAALTAGQRVAVIQLPSGSYERYVGILQATGTAAVTGGAIHAFLTTNKAGWVALPDGL